MRDILILDNRDSFVFNLQHRLFEIGHKSVVLRSDSITVAEIAEFAPSAIVVSPGPGHPRDAGISVEAISAFSGRVPILGVCLGHQAIAAAFGSDVVPDGSPCHGRATRIDHVGHPLFDGIPSGFAAGRYHSLAVVEPVSDELDIIARGDGLVMAVAHRRHPTYGVQFHPESVLSPYGTRVLANFATCAELTAPP